MSRSYHTFKGFDLGIKPENLSRWIGTPDFICPYCVGQIKQIGQVQIDREIFTLHLCQHKDCAKMSEGREDARRHLYIRWDAALKKRVEEAS